MKKKSKCPFCGNEFVKDHGNRIYCTDNCKKNQKAANQFKLYGILKDFRKGFLHNFRLFEKLVPKTGTRDIPYQEIRIQGFSEYCYYGTYKYEGRTWYQIHNFSFTIYLKDKITYLLIQNSDYAN